MANDVEFNIIARDKASSTFSKVGRSSRDAESGISKLGTSAKHALGAVLAFETAKTVTKGLIGMAKAAAEDQTSVALLAKQFKNSAHATNLQIASTEAWITKVGIARGVADDELRPALGNLVTATHSVRKAQELANLAMNIAAAKGKPLSAVSMALSKAYNGNVGALGRLGIKTKDNAGKTLTFVAAQKMLNQQFGGAANAKAKTFTGVMDRFHVAVQEGGEAIGYKMLPQLTKFVPKMSKFITGMQDGTGAGGRFVDEVKSNVLPVVRNLAAEGKLLFQAVKPIVGVLSSLPPGLVATGGASAILGTRLGSLRPQLAEGASSFSKLGRAAASAAGGLGLLGVADAANRTSPALGGLEGALGGAVAGFAATGNPIGALIGGVGGGLLGIFSAGSKASDSINRTGAIAAEARPKIQAYADSLNAGTRAITGMTRATVVDNLTTSKSYQAARQLGLATDVVTRAALGRHDAQVQVNNAIQKGLNGSFEQRAAAVLLGTQLKLNQNQLKADTIKVNEHALALGKYAKVLPGLDRKVQTRIGVLGLKNAESGIVRLTRRYHLTPTEVKTILVASGEKPTAKRIQSIIDKAKELGKVGKGKATTITPSVKPDGAKSVFDRMLSALGMASKNKAPKIKPAVDGRGATVTMSGVLSNLQAQANNHPIVIRTKRPSGGGGGGGTGGSNDRIFGGRGRSLAGRRSESENWYHSFVVAVTKGTPKVSVALDRAKSGVDKLNQSLSSLKDTRAEFTSTFSADSIFGADLETTGSNLSGLLQFQSQQAQTAQQLLNDIRTVTSNGLSKGLVSQLQAAGSSGAAQLHLLAGANSQQIAQFNSLNAQTANADSAAGLLAGNYVRGGSIDSQIATSQAEVRMAQAVERELSKMSLKGEVKLKGGDLIVAVRTTNHNRGRQPGDFSK